MFKAYMSEDEVHIYAALTLDSSSVEQLVSSYTNTYHVSRTYSDSWREYIPLHVDGIVVRSHNSAVENVGTDTMSIVIDIMSKVVKSMMSELCWESIMMYGTPIKEFTHLARSYKCHYIQPHEWDDDITDMSRFCNLDVYHYPNMLESNNSIVPNSINIVMSDEGYKSVKGGVLILYLPSYSDNAIRRNEFEIYMAIGLPTDIVRPYNSIEFDLSDSNVYRVLNLIHVQNMTITLHYHPSLRAYIESI
jgi:hypothetical protein